MLKHAHDFSDAPKISNADRAVIIEHKVLYRLDDGKLFDPESWGITAKTKKFEIDDSPREEFDGRSLRCVELERRKLAKAVRLGWIKRGDITVSVDDDEYALKLIADGRIKDLLRSVMAGDFDEKVIQKGSVSTLMRRRAAFLSVIAKLKVMENWDDVVTAMIAVANGSSKISEQQERVLRDMITIIMSDVKQVEAAAEGKGGLDAIIAEFYNADGSGAKIGIANK